MSLLTTDLLVADQVTSMLSNDFAVHDAGGTPVGRVHTEGGLGQRMLMGSRDLTVYDADGTPSFVVQDSLSMVLDHYQLVLPDGTALARVVQEFALLRLRFRIELPDGTGFELTGRLLQFEFEVTAGDHRVAQVARTWSSVGAALLGRNRYIIAFDPAAPGHVRQAVLGATIALDLYRAKKARGSG